MVDDDPTVSVAYCGLSCAHCCCTVWWECIGCRAGGGSPQCRVRRCAVERGFSTCAECPEMDSCRDLNSAMSKIYDLVFRTKRSSHLREICAEGLEAFAVRHLGTR